MAEGEHIVCQNCDTQLPADAAFCFRCGTPVEQITREVAPIPQKQGSPSIVWRILAALADLGHAWWLRFSVAKPAGKVAWGCLPILGFCAFCSLAVSALPDPTPDTDATYGRAGSDVNEFTSCRAGKARGAG